MSLTPYIRMLWPDWSVKNAMIKILNSHFNLLKQLFPPSQHRQELQFSLAELRYLFLCNKQLGDILKCLFKPLLRNTCTPNLEPEQFHPLKCLRDLRVLTSRPSWTICFGLSTHSHFLEVLYEEKEAEEGNLPTRTHTGIRDKHSVSVKCLRVRTGTKKPQQILRQYSLPMQFAFYIHYQLTTTNKTS